MARTVRRSEFVPEIDLPVGSPAMMAYLSGEVTEEGAWDRYRAGRLVCPEWLWQLCWKVRMIGWRLAAAWRGFRGEATL